LPSVLDQIPDTLPTAERLAGQGSSGRDAPLTPRHAESLLPKNCAPDRKAVT
jgi:hypothetical protein